MAAKQVFDTGELLEAVLAQLPCRDLLLCQRVCMTWKEAIGRSAQLQRALFIKAVSPALEAFLDSESMARLTAAPPGVDPLDILSGNIIPEYWRWALSDHDPIATVPLINPLLCRLCDRVDGCRVTFRITATPVLRSGSQSESSWRDMLLTQPPIFKITVVHDERNKTVRNSRARIMTPYHWAYSHHMHSHITNATGVTLGDLIDHLQTLFPDGGSVKTVVEPLRPSHGSYWRRVVENNISADSLQDHIRKYQWAKSTKDQTAMGWRPNEDGINSRGQTFKEAEISDW